MNRRGFLAGAAVVGVGVVGLRKPPRPKPPHPHATTTTTEAATTTSTTVQMTGPAPPLTISTGGTYRGWWRSTATGTPAVTVNTTQPVTIVNSKIDHAGVGIEAGTPGVQLTVTDTVFERSNPGEVTSGSQGRAILATTAATLVVEHNRFVRGNGTWVGTSGTLTGRFRYNRSEDVGYWGLNDCSIQMFQADGSAGLTMAGYEIAWNHSTNLYGQSHIEDNVNLFQVSGASGNVIDVHHNLIDGAYATSANGDGYTGGGILAGDQGGSWVTIRDNWVVSTSNYGVSIVGGSHNHHLRNTVVSDSLTQTSVLHSPTFGTGVVAWDAHSTGTMTDIVLTDNVSGWVRRTGVGSATERSDFYYPAATSASGSTSMSDPIDSTDEQAARDAWDTARSGAGVTVGPR